MKIAMVTHVPFWQRTTGAMARMWSLADFLIQTGHQFNVFFVGPDELVPANNSLPFPVVASYQSSMMSRIGKWFKQSTLGSSLNSQQSNNDHKNIVPMQVDDFKDQAAIDSFKVFIERHQPSVVIFEYIAMTYLAHSLKNHNPVIRTIIDTHDVLSRRNESFGQRGHQHWLNVTPQQEADALNTYDAILAIQETEARTFQKMVPERTIIVAGHAVNVAQNQVAPTTTTSAAQADETDSCITIGFLGSRNDANADAIQWFLDECWPGLVDSLNDPPGIDIKLLIVGGVTEMLNRDYCNMPGVFMEPATPDTRSFYERIDVAINPVRFGTGLKIKNVEALLYGKPLVTTTHGIEAFDEKLAAMIAYGDSPAEFSGRLIECCRDLSNAVKIAQSLQSTVQRQFEPGSVYSDLNNWINAPQR